LDDFFISIASERNGSFLRLLETSELVMTS